MAAALMVSACQGIFGPTQTGPRRSGTNLAASASPKTPTSAVPSSIASQAPTASPGPTTTPASPVPSVPTTLLTGLIQINASYFITAGGGNLITAGGGNFITAGGGNIISAGGGNFITAGGGNLVTAGGGNFITAGGGNFITAGGGNYRLVDFSLLPLGVTSGAATSTGTASGTAAAIPPGLMLPVKGMVVVPVSLTTGKLLGQPVKTDQTGNYQVTVPQSETDNIRLLAAVPGNTASDAVVSDSRLQYSWVVPPTANTTSPVLDEDANAATAMLRRSLVLRMKDVMFVMSENDIQNLVVGSWGTIPEEARTLISAQMIGLKQQAQKVYPTPPSDDVQTRLAQNVVDTMVALTPLDSVQIQPLVAAGYTGQCQDQVVPALEASFKLIRGKVDEKLASEPDYFTHHPEIFTANGTFKPHGTYTIKKDADFGNFIIDEFLAVDDSGSFDYLGTVLGLLGIGDITDLSGQSHPIQNYLQGATTSIVFSYTAKLQNDTNFRNGVYQAIANFPKTDADRNHVTL